MTALEDRLRRRENEIEEIETRLSTTEYARTIKYTNKTFLQPEIPPQLPSILCELQSLFKEAEAYLKAEELTSFQQAVLKFNERLIIFDSEYPKTLLGVDIHRKLANLQDKANEAAQKIWESSIDMSSTFLKLETSQNVEFIATNNYTLREQVIKKLGTILKRCCSDLSITGLHVSGRKLNWKPTNPSSITELVNNVEVFIKFLAEHAPKSLIQATSNRFGSQVITNLTRTGFPKLYPETKPDTKVICDLLNRLNNTLKETGWARSSELAYFVANFDTVWSDHRRKKYLAQLRQIYRDATPISEEARQQLILPVGEETGDDGDDWDWNDDDGEEEAEAIVSRGQVVELWKLYSNELEPITPEPFLTLYKAIVPHAYSQNNIWIYADTLMLSQHLPPVSCTELQAFAAKHLQEYMLDWRETFDNNILPQIFGKQQSKYLKELANTVDNIAIATNEVGGPDLRQSVLGRLVEQTAVYVIRAIEQTSDIGDEESKQYAALISKLGTLAVYFVDVNLSVPSWNKLEMLRQILISNLATIQEMHNQHLLLDFTSAELTSLVESLFVDSPMRLKVTQGFRN